MPEKPRNVGASVRQRLLNLARASGQPLELLLTRYALERLLHRLSISPHRHRFVDLQESRPWHESSCETRGVAPCGRRPTHPGSNRKSLPSGRIWPPSITIVVPVM